MTTPLRPASAEESLGIWPAVSADRIFDSAERFSAYRDEAPWRVRVSEKGAAAVLGEWRRHLDVLVMRGVWCAERLVPDVVADAAGVAREQGFARVLSPLLPEVLLSGYRRAGMERHLRIVAVQGVPALVVGEAPVSGVNLHLAHAEDLADIAALDSACFDDFWRYGPPELLELLATERAVVARSGSGELIGYTLATVSRGAATLGRLAVSPDARRRGVGRALVADVALWAAGAGAVTLGLCTQEENNGSRALYAACGLREIDDRYAMAIGDARDMA